MNIFTSNSATEPKNMDPYKEKNADKEATLKEKIEGLSTFVTACKFGMMTTRDAATGMLSSRCMALAGEEIGGIDLLFHTNRTSGKASELASDAHVNLAFLNPTGEWASISGSAIVLTDRETVKKYYSPALKAWLGDLGDGKHDGGPEDPRIAVIRVEMKTATYALAKGNAAGRAVEMVKGMVVGNVPAVNQLREIGEGEVLMWRESQKLVT